MKQTIIRGVTYPSRAAAARALGVTVDAMNKALAEGRLDTVGLGQAGRAAMAVMIRGKTYPSARAAARALRVTPGAIYQALSKGRIDRVGLPPSPRRAASKPVILGGFSWPSLRSASLDLGFVPDFLSRALRRPTPGKTARIMAAVMAERARRDNAAVAARRARDERMAA